MVFVAFVFVVFGVRFVRFSFFSKEVVGFWIRGSSKILGRVEYLFFNGVFFYGVLFKYICL